MRSAQPPKLATWLLNHFGRSPNNATVVGDLDERYRDGRSAAWYWRQVIIAIAVSFFTEARQHKPVGIRGLFAIMLTGLLAGVVQTLQTSHQLSFFGATGFTGALVTLSLVRELGPVLAALVVAGIMGSETLGTNYRKQFALRFLTTIAILPVLTIVADLLGIIGGLLVAVSALRINPHVYLSRAADSLKYADLFSGLLKPIVFGALLAVVSCLYGLRTPGGTPRRRATQMVVASAALILSCDLLLTRLILAYTL
jgi:phospholipid/cholesterol/gamma-HCH transport system permease protein